MEIPLIGRLITWPAVLPIFELQIDLFMFGAYSGDVCSIVTCLSVSTSVKLFVQCHSTFGAGVFFQFSFSTDVYSATFAIDVYTVKNNTQKRIIPELNRIMQISKICSKNLKSVCKSAQK